MKKFLLIYSTFILPLLSFSQVQITDFKNIEATSPSNFQFIDTLNNRLLFSTFIAERTNQYVLWTTDGTTENTEELKDKKGGNPTNFYNEKIRLGRNLYIKDNGIWKTNGNKIEKIVDYSDSLMNIQQFEGKILVYFKNYGSDNNYLYWLDESDKLSLFEKDFVSYKIINGEVFFVKPNPTNSKWEFKKYSNNKTQLIASFEYKDTKLERFEHFAYQGNDYYLLNGHLQSKLIVVNQTNNEVTIKDWGENVYAYSSFVIRDENNNPYLFKNADSITVYSLAQNNLLKEVFVVAYKDIAKDPTSPPVYIDYGLVGNTLCTASIHVIATFPYDYYTYFAINTYNSKTKKYRRTPNLLPKIGRMQVSNSELKPLTEDEYQIDNNLGQIFKYSFEKDTLILISEYKYPRSGKPDSIFKVNNTKLLLRDNIYKITEKDTISIIPQKKIYSPDGADSQLKQLNDKLLFWFYNYKTKQRQLWASNGEKTGSELLFTDAYDLKIIGNKAYFYHRINLNTIVFYSTDGTIEGTKKLWQSENSDYIGDALSNEHQVIYEVASTNSRRIIVIEDGIVNEINDIPISRYNIVLTRKNVYIVLNYGDTNGKPSNEIYKLEGSKSRLIDNAIYDIRVYRDKLYYIKLSSTTKYEGLYSYNEVTNQVSVITKNNLYRYNIYGNKLIYEIEPTQQSNDYTHTYTILNLPSDTIDLTMSYTTPYSLAYFNIQNIDENSLIFSNYKKVIYIKNNIKREFDLKYELYDPPIKYGNGILIQEVIGHNYFSPIKLTYYDSINNTVTPILDNVPHGETLHKVDANFILIPVKKSSTEWTWKQWNHYTKTLQDLDGGFSQINRCSAFGVKQEGNQSIYSYWNFDGRNLNKTYKIEGNIGDISYVSSDYLKREETYFGFKSQNIIALGKDSTISIARMIKENEGFNLFDIFQFKNQLYAYTFTYNEGYQVWKLPQLTNDKRNQLSQNCSSLFNSTDVLSTEENNVEINICPNPASQNLYVGIEETTDYQIIDIKGSIIMKGKVSSTEPINISTLQPNIYFIRLQQQKFSFSRRFMKF